MAAALNCIFDKVNPLPHGVSIVHTTIEGVMSCLYVLHVAYTVQVLF